jgi:hypothetical protein
MKSYRNYLMPLVSIPAIAFTYSEGVMPRLDALSARCLSAPAD